MSNRNDDLWKPADYDDEPRSNGNFGKPSWAEVFEALDADPVPADVLSPENRDRSLPQSRAIFNEEKVDGAE